MFKCFLCICGFNLYAILLAYIAIYISKITGICNIPTFDGLNTCVIIMIYLFILMAPFLYSMDKEDQ